MTFMDELGAHARKAHADGEEYTASMALIELVLKLNPDGLTSEEIDGEAQRVTSLIGHAAMETYEAEGVSIQFIELPDEADPFEGRKN